MLLAAVLVLAAAVPAGAKKPDKPGPPPSDEILAGTMCDPAEYPDGVVGIQTDDFEFTLGGRQDGTCIDVLTDVAGPWTVTITGDGARYLGVIPRDSIGPGDSCGGYLVRSGIYDHGPGNPLVMGYEGSVPAATINACGTEFGEWVDETLVDADACVAFDPDDGYNESGLCQVNDAVPIAHPLVLQVFLKGQAGTTTHFVVDLP